MALDLDKSIDVIYLDLTKAFDSVPHDLLLAKLKSIGLSGKLLNWFKSYLYGRYLTVRIGQNFSKKYYCSSGVPQGGVLSPLLFLIYTIELPQILKISDIVHIRIYADDIKIYGVYDNLNYDEVHATLQQSLQRMYEWASNNGLCINPRKCSYLHLGKSTASSYSIHGTEILRSEYVKDLGIMIDSKLDFSLHIDNVVKKAYSTMFTLFRNVHCTNPIILSRLYKAYIIPLVEYCCNVWNPVRKKHITKIEKVQRIFTRLLFSKCFHDVNYTNMPNYKIRISRLFLTSLEKRRIISDLVFCYRILRKEINLAASKYWMFRPTSARIGGFNLHYRGKIKYKRCGLFNYIFHRCARWFRKLPNETFNVNSCTAFKSKLAELDLISLLSDKD